MTALHDRGLAVEYLLLPDEGHVLGIGQGFSRQLNNQAIFAALERFLAQRLKIRYQESMTPEVAQRLKEIGVDPEGVGSN